MLFYAKTFIMLGKHMLSFFKDIIYHVLFENLIEFHEKISKYSKRWENKNIHNLMMQMQL